MATGKIDSPVSVSRVIINNNGHFHLEAFPGKTGQLAVVQIRSADESLGPKHLGIIVGSVANTLFYRYSRTTKSITVTNCGASMLIYLPDVKTTIDASKHRCVLIRSSEELKGELPIDNSSPWQKAAMASLLEEEHLTRRADYHEASGYPY